MKIKIVLEIILALAAIIATAWLVAPYVMPTSEPTPEPVDEFDPRLAPASTVYEMPDGTHIRGLKMTDEAFRFMTNDVEDPFIKQDMRKQVDDAEKAYTRDYTVRGERFDYTIHNGVIMGSCPHK